jgi:uncharacterized membrane protein
MNLDAYSFKAGALRPMACLREGWQLIRQDFWLFFGITVLGVFIANLAALILAGPLMCGIHYCYLRHERSQRVELSMLFRGFDYFVPGLLATLILTAIFLLPTLITVFGSYAAFVVGMIRNAPPEPGMFVWPFVLAAAVYALCSLLLGLLRAFFLFTYPLIVDRKLEGWDAVKLSARAAWSNLGGIIVLTILIEVITLAGLLVCYVGALFCLPLIFAMISTAYRQVFEIERPEPRMAETDDSPLLALPPETGIQAAPNSSIASEPPK